MTEPVPNAALPPFSPPMWWGYSRMIGADEASTLAAFASDVGCPFKPGRRRLPGPHRKDDGDGEGTKDKGIAISITRAGV